MKFLIVLAVIAAAAIQLGAGAPADKIDCSKMDEVLDELGSAQGITTLNEKYKLVTTMDEFNKRCQEMNEAIKTLRRYNKECYSSLTQQVFSAILRTRSQMNEARCKPNSAEAAEAVESTKCIQENAFEPVKSAEQKTILGVQAILDANISDEKLRTRRACCSVLASRNLFLAATKDKCSKHEKLYTEYLDSYTSEAMGLICMEPEKLECDKLEPIKLEGVQAKGNFFLTPTIKLVKTLDH